MVQHIEKLSANLTMPNAVPWLKAKFEQMGSKISTSPGFIEIISGVKFIVETVYSGLVKALVERSYRILSYQILASMMLFKWVDLPKFRTR